MIHHLKYFFFLSSLIEINAWAQPVTHIQSLDNSSGLSNSCVISLFQDTDNLLWVGTWDGLNVYDGANFKVFNYGTYAGKQNMASNIVYHVAEDKKGNVWIATIEGITKIDKKSGLFNHFFYNKKDSKEAIGKGYLLAIDNQGLVYAAAKGQKVLYLYNETNNEFRPCPMDGMEGGNISRFFFDEGNRLWLLNDAGRLDVFRQKDNRLFREFRYNELTEITDIFSANSEIFYTTSDRRLFKSDNQVVFNQVALLPKALRTISFFRGNYILGWSSTGLAKYDASFKPVINPGPEYARMENVRVTIVRADGNGVLWVGTDGNGLIKFNENDNTFGMVKRLPDGRPMNIPVRAFLEVDDELWVGTKGDGIIALKHLGKPKSTSRNFRNFISASDLLDNCVYSIIEGMDGLIYIGSDAAGITIYDKTTKRFTKWEEIEGTASKDFFRSVHSIITDTDGSVWLGTESFGLIRALIKRGPGGSIQLKEFENYRFADTIGPANDVIYSLSLGKSGRVWVGCRYGGLSIFNKATKEFTTYKAFSYEGAISNNDILSLFLDAKNKMWIGTSFGLNWINENDIIKEKPVFEKLSLSDGLPNNTVHAITADEKGDIWVSTNNGLARINVSSRQVFTYKETDGLQSNEFSDNAVWKNKEGYLFFGGIYGFNYFHPSRILLNNEQPNLLLSDIQMAGIFQNRYSLNVLNRTRENKPLVFTLKPQDNFFELKAKAITFSNQGKVEYAYLLKGHDKTWSYTGDDGRIAYTGIAPGHYTLLVKWSNGSGQWSKPAEAMKVKVDQYFWLTIPAFMVYAFLLWAGAYAFYRYKRNKVIMKQQLDIEHMLRKKDEEIHAEQLNFFTNIAHELQTPLTLINGSLERFFTKNKNLKSPLPHQNFLQIVNHQSSRLSYLVHQLLEFRKAESGNLKNSYTHLNISSLFSNISSLFEPISEQKGISFECHAESGIEVWMDRDKMEKIFFNLISNAFKHAPDNEQIICTLHKYPERDCWELVIANTGCTLSVEDTRKLFSKFFIAKDNVQQKLSSGIGLAFTRELVNMLKGDINVTVKGTWIYFKVTMPLSFVPAMDERAEFMEKPEQPSYLIEAMAVNQTVLAQPEMMENNKRALMESLDDNQRKNILIIEDEPALRFLLNDLLKDRYIIYEAGTGREAIELMTRIVPDLIISDVMMPDMDGLEVCNIVKNTPATCHIPVIILSARGTDEQKLEGYEAGADAYIPKPFRSEHLLVRIRKLLEYQTRMHEMFKQDGVVEKIPTSGMKDEDRQFLKRTIDLITENLEQEDLDAAFIEKEIGMSKAHFYRRLKALSGMTPGEMIKSIRLEQAAHLLKTSERTVLEIFYQTGFNNQSHFYREFKKKYNSSPNDYRASFNLKVERRIQE
jgi:ligand-binding sensor domain-containing protein/signal transduction histidine kinase/DNA-binding response OmpR family regulator